MCHHRLAQCTLLTAEPLSSPLYHFGKNRVCTGKSAWLAVFPLIVTAVPAGGHPSCWNICLCKVLQKPAGALAASNQPHPRPSPTPLQRPAKTEDQGCLGRGEVSPLQVRRHNVSYEGCTMQSARSQTRLIPLCLLTGVDRHSEGLAGWAQGWEDQARASKGPSLKNVTDSDSV